MELSVRYTLVIVTEGGAAAAHVLALIRSNQGDTFINLIQGVRLKKQPNFEV
jgi:hypothetical protein